MKSLSNNGKNNAYTYFFVTMLVLVIISALASMAPSLLLQVWESQESEISTDKILFIVGLIVVTNLISILIVGYREKFAEKYNEKNCYEQVRKLCGVRYDDINNVGPSNYLEKVVGAVNSIYSYMTGTNIQIWSEIIIAGISLVLVARASILLALIMIAIVPIQVLGFKALNKELNARAMRMQQDTGAGFQEMLSCLQQTDYIKQLDSYEEICNAMKPSIRKMYSSMARVNRFARTSSLALNSITGIAQNIIVLVAVFSFYEGRITAYSLMILTMLAPLYFTAIRGITDANIDKKDFNVANKLIEELDSRQEDLSGNEIDDIDNIAFDVNGLVVGDRNINVIANGTAQKGEIVQLVGESGMGKSSLAKAVVKFRDESGIRINGRDLRDISRRSVRNHVEYVSQNIPIIRGTLKENIEWGVKSDLLNGKNLLDTEIMRAVFANKTLDDYIDEGGANLSGGEKQKIAIARALLKNPKVLILDEVCSNIDKETSEEIYQIVGKEKNRRITLVISHDDMPEGFVDKKIELKRA